MYRSKDLSLASSYASDVAQMMTVSEVTRFVSPALYNVFTTIGQIIGTCEEEQVFMVLRQFIVMSSTIN